MDTSNPVVKHGTRAWRISVGAVLLLLAATITARMKPTGDIGGALGHLTFLLILIIPAVWLIASGLPRSVAPNTDLKKVRRRIWYKLAGLGFAVMLVLAIGLAALSWFMAAVLVTWVYWFGWTWIAWLIADKRAVRQLGS